MIININKNVQKKDHSRSVVVNVIKVVVSQTGQCLSDFRLRLGLVVRAHIWNAVGNVRNRKRAGDREWDGTKPSVDTVVHGDLTGVDSRRNRRALLLGICSTRLVGVVSHALGRKNIAGRGCNNRHLLVLRNSGGGGGGSCQTGTSELLGLSVHASYTAGSQRRIGVGVSPAIHRSLNESSLLSDARVDVRQAPANAVAFSLVLLASTFVLFARNTSPGVNAVLLLELVSKHVDVDGFNVATDGVLLEKPVLGVVKGDPVNSILVTVNTSRRSAKLGPVNRRSTEIRLAKRSVAGRRRSGRSGSSENSRSHDARRNSRKLHLLVSSSGSSRDHGEVEGRVWRVAKRRVGGRNGRVSRRGIRRRAKRARSIRARVGWGFKRKRSSRGSERWGSKRGRSGSSVQELVINVGRRGHIPR